MASKPQLEQEILSSLLNMPLEEMERRYGIAEPVDGVENLLKIEEHAWMFVQKGSLHLVHAGCDGIPSVARVVREVRKRDLPLSILFLLSSTEEWSANLWYYRELSEMAPELFGFRLLTHPRNEGFANGGQAAAFTSDEEYIKLGGRKYYILRTPGHRLGGDQLSLFELGSKVLIVADLLQPQGEIYEYCSFLTPVPDHHEPDNAVMSLQNLRTLPFERILCGEGQVLDRSRGYIWIEVTQKVLERMAYHCRKVLWEEDQGSLEENARNVFLKLGMERNMSLDPLYHRMERPKSGGLSLFQKHDLPPIARYLTKFGGGREA